MTSRAIPLVLVCLALLTGLAPAARAQTEVLDGEWFEVKVRVKGAAIDAVTEETESIKGTVTAYLLVTSEEPTLAPKGEDDEGGGDGAEGAALGDPALPGDLFLATVVSEVSPDDWAVTGCSFFRLAGEQGVAMVGATQGSQCGVLLDVVVPDEDSTSLLVAFTGRMKVKTDKDGLLKKASFKSEGGLLLEGFGDGDVLFGGARVKGATVDVDDLPFNPEEILDLVSVAK